MIKVKIYIKSEYSLFEEEVFIDALLPNIPNIGNLIFLENEQQYELELKAKSSLEIANKFAPRWFYTTRSLNIKQGGDVKEENLKDLSFGEAMYVHNVVYEPNSEVVKIVIGDDTYNEDN